MSKFLSYLRNDKGGAVEYVLVMAGVAALVVGVASSTAMKTSVNAMFQGVFDQANKKANVAL